MDLMRASAPPRKLRATTAAAPATPAPSSQLPGAVRQSAPKQMSQASPAGRMHASGLPRPRPAGTERQPVSGSYNLPRKALVSGTHECCRVLILVSVSVTIVKQSNPNAIPLCIALGGIESQSLLCLPDAARLPPGLNAVIQCFWTCKLQCNVLQWSLLPGSDTRIKMQHLGGVLKVHGRVGLDCHVPPPGWLTTVDRSSDHGVSNTKTSLWGDVGLLCS